MHQSRSIAREIGTAFAVLAIYLLTILAPMHQARASQLDFAALGYQTEQSGWVLCNPANTGEQDRDVLVAKCPAAGIGKNDVLAPSTLALPVHVPLASLAAPLPAYVAVFDPAPAAPPNGSRAPPAQV